MSSLATVADTGEPAPRAIAEGQSPEQVDSQPADTAPRFASTGLGTEFQAERQVFLAVKRFSTQRIPLNTPRKENFLAEKIKFIAEKIKFIAEKIKYLAEKNQQ